MIRSYVGTMHRVGTFLTNDTTLAIVILAFTLVMLCRR